jgi:integrase
MPGKHRGHGKGTIARRADSRWVAAISLESGKRKFYYGALQREVVDKLNTTLHDQQQGTLITARDQPFGTYLAKWLEDAVKPSVRAKTHESHARQVRVHIAPALGKIPLSKLTALHLQGFYQKMVGGGPAPSSVGRQHAIIHRALAKAERWRLVGRNVADLVDPPRADRKEMAPLTPEQTSQFLEAARESRYYALFVLAVTSGMRQSELLGLTWRDVDFERGSVHIRQQLVYVPGAGFPFSEPKTAKGRQAIALPDLAIAALRQHRRCQVEEQLKAPEWVDIDLVFANEVGKPEERGNLVRRHLHPILTRAGLPRVRFHDLRHTAATLLLSLGSHPKVVQERLGHSTIAVTLDVYSHVLPTIQRDAVSKLDGLLGASASG